MLVQKHAWLVIVLESCSYTDHMPAFIHTHTVWLSSQVRSGTPQSQSLTVLLSHCQSGSKVIWSRSFGHVVLCRVFSEVIQHRRVPFIYKNMSYAERHSLFFHDFNYDFQDGSNFSLELLPPTFLEIWYKIHFLIVLLLQFIYT